MTRPTTADQKKYARLGRIRSNGAIVFIHPCVVCGSRAAPFGSGVNLLEAMAQHDKQKLGRWYCGEHRNS